MQKQSNSIHTNNRQYSQERGEAGKEIKKKWLKFFSKFDPNNKLSDLKTNPKQDKTKKVQHGISKSNC